MLCDLLEAVIDSLDVDVDLVCQIVRSLLRKRCESEHARIQEDDVDLSELRFCLLEKACNFGCIRDVCLDEGRLAALGGDLSDDSIAFALPSSRDDDRCALAGQSESGCLADARGCASDDADLVV